MNAGADRERLEERFEELVASYLEGDAGDRELEELAELVDREPDLREAFCELTGVHGMLGAAHAADDVKERLTNHVLGSLAAPEQRERTKLEVLSRIRQAAEQPASSGTGARSSGRRARGAARRRVGGGAAWGLYAALAAAAAAAVLVTTSSGPREDAKPAGRPVAASSPDVPVDPSRVAGVEEPAPAAPVEPPAATEALPRDDVEPETAAPSDERPTPGDVPAEPEDAGDESAQRVARVEPTPEVNAPPPPAVGGGHVAYVDRTRGDVEIARAGSDRWFDAKPGFALSAGDRVRVKLAFAKISFESGSALYANQWTTLAVRTADDVPSVDLVAGEVYVETVKRDVGFRVETPHGRAVDLGTRFGVQVDRVRGTTVVVAEGRVEASTEGGSAAVRADEEVLLVRRTMPPGAVREARDVDKRLAWVEGDRERLLLFADDFQRSPPERWPARWLKHETEAATRSGFRVLADGAEPANRVVTCPRPAPGESQHAYVPLAAYPATFEVSLRMRLPGGRNSRAGVEFVDTGDRVHPEVTYDAGSGLLKGTHRRPAVRDVSTAPLRLEPGCWYDVTITVTPTRIEGRVGDAAALGLDISGAGRMVRASLVSRGADAAEFDDIRIVKLPAAPRRRGRD